MKAEPWPGFPFMPTPTIVVDAAVLDAAGATLVCHAEDDPRAAGVRATAPTYPKEHQMDQPTKPTPDTPPPLPPMPDVDQLIAAARERRAHFLTVRDAAQEEIDKAEEYIRRLGGTTSVEPRVSDRAVLSCLRALGRHSYASGETIASAAHVSDTTVGRAMRLAESRGHVLIEGTARKFRYRITDAGRRWVVEQQRTVEQP